MNTKQTRVVVTLLLAIATLATMGLRTTNDRGGLLTIYADYTTCELVPASLSAIELLDFVDDACDPDLIDRIETEIGWSTSSQVSAAELLNSTLGRSGFSRSGMSEYLAIVEADEDTNAVAASGARFEAFIDYHDPSSPYADSEQRGGLPALSRGAKTWSTEFLDYHDPSSPWADVETVSSGRGKSGSAWSIDYHNPSSAWADDK